MTRVVVTGGSGKAGRAIVPDLVEHGYDVVNVDMVPAVQQHAPFLRADLTDLGQTIEALRGADAAVVSTEWPQFRQADWAKIVPQMRQPVFVDANRFLEKELKSVSDVEHLSVGRAK